MDSLHVTEDGSLTTRDAETGELYHNRAGAYSEALLNYVNPSGALRRLQAALQLSILDVCFGLGYNSFVLLQEAIDSHAEGKISIHAIEKDASILEYLPQILSNARFATLRNYLHPSQLQQQRQLAIHLDNLHIELFLEIDTVENVLPRFSSIVDYVYHDPFSPGRMPELWTLDIFRRYYAVLADKKGAVLTYSSAGAVRGGLAQAGFIVGKTAALGGKSGGTIGIIDESCADFEYTQLNDDELKRISSIAGIPYKNRDFLLGRHEILRLRELEQSQLRPKEGGRSGEKNAEPCVSGHSRCSDVAEQATKERTKRID